MSVYILKRRTQNLDFAAKEKLLKSWTSITNSQFHQHTTQAVTTSDNPFPPEGVGLRPCGSRWYYRATP